MPSFQKKTVVKSYKLRIKNKFKSLVDETDDVVTKLQSCVSVFEKRLEELLKSSDENFLDNYQKLTEDFENHQEKLCYLLAAVESTGNDEDSEDSESEETISISKHSSKLLNQPSALESKSSLSSYCSTPDNKNVSGPQFVSCPNQSENGGASNSSGLPKSKDVSLLSREQLFLEKKSSSPSLNCRQVEDTSVSQFSCDRPSSSGHDKISSLSINRLDSPISVNTEVKKLICDNELAVSGTEENIQIPPCNVALDEIVSASLTHIVNPSDFWMQLQNSKVSYMFPLSEFCNDSPPSYLKKGSFCLAPFKSCLQYYYRAKVLDDALGCEDVEVLFIDHGSIQNMSLKSLRALPIYAYETPSQAFHCKLFNVLPINKSWTVEATEKLKEFHDNIIQAHVKSVECDTYAVQLTINISSFLNEFSCDIAESLCLDGLAVFEMEPELNTESCVAGNTNQTSCDSGVSVSSHRTTATLQPLLLSSGALDRDVPSHVFKSFQDKNGQTSEISSSELTDILSLTPFDSSDAINDEIGATSMSDSNLGSIPAQQCLKSMNCNCLLHVTIPPPYISFVEEDKMLVMIAHITSPSEFYVNLAMEDSSTLDDLQEKMTAFYDNETNPSEINPVCLTEDIMCAGRYSDGNWYRVIILSTDQENETGEFYVQYIDYGNKTFLKCNDLRPLQPEFASYPSFSIKCSLAGIMPKHSDSRSNHYNPTHWNKNAIKKFQQLANFDRCLTAQIFESRVYSTPNLQGHFSKRKPIQVLLWDTEGGKEILINRALLESGVADLDMNFVKKLEADDIISSKEKTFLQHWDPMNEEYNSLSNSYGVDVDDSQVAICGYRQKDEDYTCKYYSLRGYCPRGDHCPFKHFELDSGGCTRDQDEIYSMDLIPPLPDVPCYALVTISAVKHPGLFFSVLPFGKNTVNDVDVLYLSEPDECKMYRDEVDALYNGLNNHYNNSVFVENTTVALAYGSIVVAWNEGCKAWQRGRIIELTDIHGPCRVFFVDFGDECWVPRKDIREIFPQFLYTPFQAIECHLYDVEPLGFEKGKSWSIPAINRFKELVSNEVLLAHITLRLGHSLHIKLRLTREEDHSDISDILVKEGFAQYVTVNASKFRESKYVPG